MSYENPSWHITGSMLVTDKFSLPLDRIDTVRMAIPICCLLLSLIFIAIIPFMAFAVYENKSVWNNIAGVVLIIILFNVIAYFWNAKKIIIIAKGKKYKKTALFFPSERESLVDLKSSIERKIGALINNS